MFTARMLGRRQAIGAIALLVGATCLHQQAHGNAILNSGNAAIQGITGAGQLDQPYGTLQITGDTSTGLVTFMLDTTPHNASAPINAVFNDISFNTALKLGTDFTLKSGPAGSQLSAGGNVSEFGSFDYTVGGTGASARARPYSFVLALTDPSKAVASNFEVPNSAGFSFAAHMYTKLSKDGNTDSVTGFIAGGDAPAPTPVPIPEPSIMTMVVACLAPLGARAAVRRHRRRSADAA